MTCIYCDLLEQGVPLLDVMTPYANRRYDFLKRFADQFHLPSVRVAGLGITYPNVPVADLREFGDLPIEQFDILLPAEMRRTIACFEGVESGLFFEHEKHFQDRWNPII